MLCRVKRDIAGSGNALLHDAAAVRHDADAKLNDLDAFEKDA